ncbi:hypothetical protein ACO22_00983 [Paracoccidioides brasiliensis]|uniref:Inosine/uridine-preferring nucleoside hydrolase domain-containing protein n=1 Tax=Paracoccidioides brasiliensis TaxID=121759 RepID=A0A1D2JMM7_PARBR|nr:hypothetical protein ACO22_00983 [Paracoccidioides brasiliensis]
MAPVSSLIIDTDPRILSVYTKEYTWLSPIGDHQIFASAKEDNPVLINNAQQGVDDILALLLALSSRSDEIEVQLISLTFGNIDVRSCLRNVASMFHTIEREMKWRRENGKPEGFDALKAYKPTVAVGADCPLDDELMMADYFHGRDGLGNIHFSHPHLTPQQTWESLFFSSTENNTVASTAESALDPSQHSLFIASTKPAHQEILRVLKENDPDTITIVAIGPLTNLALAAAEDPETFLRTKEVVVMGGTIDVPGNITPVAEFNTFADAAAAARVFALTSTTPRSTMPPKRPTSSQHLPDYPAQLSKQLTLKLFPLDITLPHDITRGQFRAKISPIMAAGSPLAEWLSIILAHSFATLDAMYPGHDEDNAALSLHDPLCIWYALTREAVSISMSLSATGQQQQRREPCWQLTASSPEDIRVETMGRWTRGMCVVDRRNRKRFDDADLTTISDHGHWLRNSVGNRVQRMAASPGTRVFWEFLLDRIFR